MKVTLVRRWGPHSAGRTVEVDAVQGRWLVQHNYAQSTPDVTAPVQPAAAEGAHGADPLAGGDATRRRPQVGSSATRDDSANRAAAGAGVPPAFRPGYDAAARAREGVAGRNYQPPVQPGDSKKPVRRRGKPSN